MTRENQLENHYYLERAGLATVDEEILIAAHYHLMANPRFWGDKGDIDASRILCVIASNLRLRTWNKPIPPRLSEPERIHAGLQAVWDSWHPAYIPVGAWELKYKRPVENHIAPATIKTKRQRMEEKHARNQAWLSQRHKLAKS
jgi:hypothetical protein